MPLNCPAWPPDWPEIRIAVDRCLDSGEWGQYHAEICQSLEKRLAAKWQASQVRLCCSGTAALEIALRAGRIGPGDEVIVAAFDYPGNFRTIELLNARPVLLDVETTSACLDLKQIEQATSAKVRAVVASHLCGVSADVQTLRQLCDDRGWLLIEDACQVIGMTINGRHAGSFGHFSTLSFGGSKLISAGSGGALVVNSERLAARLGGLLERPGDTFPISPLQAAVINPQLDRLAECNARRQETVAMIQSQLNSQLTGWKWLSGSQAGVEAAYYKVAWAAESQQQRHRIVTVAAELGLPIGEGFRSMSGCSERRCRKPVPTPNADELGERMFVLDQRALLLPKSAHDELAAALLALHAAVL
jgi:perosamine synthetase